MATEWGEGGYALFPFKDHFPRPVAFLETISKQHIDHEYAFCFSGHLYEPAHAGVLLRPEEEQPNLPNSPNQRLVIEELHGCSVIFWRVFGRASQGGLFPMFLYEYELGKAADVLTRELFKLKPGETFVITADTESDSRVVNATARAAFAVGAKPLVIWLPSPLGVGQAADPMLPVEALTGVLKASDAWVEFNNKWLLYSTPWERALKENRKLRHMCLVGMNADMMVRCIGRVDHVLLKNFLERAAATIATAKQIRMTSPAGTDLEFRNVADGSRAPAIRDGYADKPGTYMMAGFIAWAPDLESINGTLVFDGSLVPPCGKLEQPIRLTVRAGALVKIEGGTQAREFDAWTNSFNHRQMKRLAHGSFGFGPGAKLTGDIVEDERVWGCTEWGIGHIGRHLIPPDGIPAPSHADGQSLNSSVWLDGKQFMDKGQILDPDLKKLAKRLGKA